MHWYGWNGFNCFGAFAGLGTLGIVLSIALHLAVVVGVVLLVAWLIRSLATSGQRQPSYATVSAAPDSHEILQQRYARGEITREQYLKMLEDLS